MPADIDLPALAAALRATAGLAAKADIAGVASRLGLSGIGAVPVGDDCAALPDGDGYLLFAIEGFMNEFVAADPWFAGWCGVMVNLSDVAAMGGRALAVVDAVWSNGMAEGDAILAGLRAAAERYGVPIVGGHSNLRTDRGQLAVAILGRARRLISSFDARPGDRLVTAIDLRGAYREPFANWQAALEAPGDRLRGDLEILPALAEAGLCRAGKDISQGGLVGTATMLAECSGVGLRLDVTRVPVPAGVPLERWLRTFPSFGYILAVAPEHVADVIGRFTARDIAAAEIGTVEAGSGIWITDGRTSETIRDLAAAPLLGLGPSGPAGEERAP